VIGFDGNANGYWAGHIADVRIVKGTSVYTSSFTPPTAPLTAITNTSLLTLQNRIGYNNSQPIDESGIKNVITRNGNASAGSFSPHVPTGWSAYFDGNGDQLYIASAASLTLGAGDFTIEFWYSPTDLSVQYRILADYRPGTSQGLYPTILTNYAVVAFYFNTGLRITGTTSLQVGNWYHIAVTKSGSSTKLFVNGIQDGSTLTDNNTYIGNTFYISGNAFGAGFSAHGYISNFRIVKGTALYTSNFTPPTEPLEPIANTSLLTLRSNSFVDEGPNRFAITRNGDTKITPFSPFKTHTIVPDSHSVYFDGTGDYLTAPSNAVFSFGTGDFTVEGFFYLNANKDYNLLIETITSATSTTGISVGINSSGAIYLYINSFVITSSTTVTPSNWNHFALVRNSGTIVLYLNGVSIGSTATSYNFTDTPCRIGINAGLNHSLNGYLSNVRIVKGTAVYTEAFTPPTTPLTAIANTSLLTCQSPTAIDNSNNAFAITVTGNAQPTKYNPFGETITTGVEYSLINHGGSYYFDGTGDYLNTPATGQFAPAGVFTIECFVYITSLAAARAIIGNYTTNATTDWVIDVTTAGVLRAFTNGSTARISSGSGAVQVGEWEHIVLTRNSSNVISLFLNGALIGTYSQSGVFGSASKAIYIGVQNVSTNPMLGYISNLRVVEGTALYTSAFVPPAAPPTPVRGTTLLLNGTNAAISDGVGKNVLETVGNARVINGVKKYGTGSMEFDGNNDYLKLPSNQDFAFNTGDFTIEGWLYRTGVGVAAGQPVSIICDFRTAEPQVNVLIETQGTSQKLELWVNGASRILSTTELPLNNWIHFALVRSSGSTKLYINGVNEGSAYSDTNNYTGANLVVGGRFADISGDYRSFNGYIDDLRITKGVARYTSNFTPPSSFKLK
jgi:hypothetical protein